MKCILALLLAVVATTAVAMTVGSTSANAVGFPSGSGEPYIWETLKGSFEILYPDGKYESVSRSAMEDAAKAVEGVGIDGGFTGQHATSVPGYTERVGQLVKGTIEKALGRNKKLYEDYKSYTQLNLLEQDAGWRTYMEQLGTMVGPKAGLLKSFGTIGWGITAFQVGFWIGGKLDALLGIGTQEEEFQGSNLGNMSMVFREYGSKFNAGNTNECSSYNGEGECTSGYKSVEHPVTVERVGGGEFYNHSTSITSMSSSGFPVGTWPECWHASNLNQPNGSIQVLAKPASGKPEGVGGSKCYQLPGETIVLAAAEWVEPGTITRPDCAQITGSTSGCLEGTGVGLGFPGGAEHGPNEKMSTTITAPPEITPHTTNPKELETGKKHEIAPVVPPMVVLPILKERQEIEHEPVTVPEVGNPQIPAPLPGESGTQYKERLEKDGFTKVELKTLPEAQIDPRVGPEQPSYTSPPVGSFEPVATPIIVEQNPPAAGAGQGGGAPFFEAPVPKLKVPSFGAVCEGFPFGVPCWLVKTVEGWSATGKAPTVEIPLAGKVMHVTLAGLEPAMEILRPIFGVAVTVGLVMTFFSFAIGGSGGGGGDE